MLTLVGKNLLLAHQIYHNFLSTSKLLFREFHTAESGKLEKKQTFSSPSMIPFPEETDIVKEQDNSLLTLPCYRYDQLNPKYIKKVFSGDALIDISSVPADTLRGAHSAVVARSFTYGGGSYLSMLNVELVLSLYKQASMSEECSYHLNTPTWDILSYCKVKQYRLREVKALRKLPVTKDTSENYSSLPNRSFSPKISLNEWVRNSSPKSGETVKTIKAIHIPSFLKINKNFASNLTILKAKVFSRYRLKGLDDISLLESDEFLDDIYGKGFSKMLHKYLTKYHELMQTDLKRQILFIYGEYVANIQLNCEKIILNPPTYKYLRRHLYTYYGEHVFLDGKEELSLNDLLHDSIKREPKKKKYGLAKKFGKDEPFSDYKVGSSGKYSLDPRDFFSPSSPQNEYSFRWINTPLLNINDCQLKKNNKLSRSEELLMEEIEILKTEFNKHSRTIENPMIANKNASVPSSGLPQYSIPCIDKQNNFIQLHNYPLKTARNILHLSVSSLETIKRRFWCKKETRWNENCLGSKFLKDKRTNFVQKYRRIKKKVTRPKVSENTQSEPCYM